MCLTIVQISDFISFYKELLAQTYFLTKLYSHFPTLLPTMLPLGIGRNVTCLIEAFSS